MTKFCSPRPRVPTSDSQLPKGQDKSRIFLYIIHTTINMVSFVCDSCQNTLKKAKVSRQRGKRQKQYNALFGGGIVWFLCKPKPRTSSPQQSPCMTHQNFLRTDSVCFDCYMTRRLRRCGRNANTRDDCIISHLEKWINTVDFCLITF